MSKASALELFNSLSMEEVREQIAEIDAGIAALEKRRDSLKTIERAIDIRDNGKPKRTWITKRKQKAQEKSADSSEGQPADDHQSHQPPVRSEHSVGRQTSPETVQLRDRLYKILRTRGPMKVGDLSRELHLEYGKVQNALYGPQFRKLDDGKFAIR